MIKTVGGRDVLRTTLQSMVKTEASAAGASFMDSMAQAVARTNGNAEAGLPARGAQNAQLRAQEDINGAYRAEEAPADEGADRTQRTDGEDKKEVETDREKEVSETEEPKDTAKTDEAGKDGPAEETEETTEAEGDALQAQAALSAQAALATEDAALANTALTNAQEAQGVQPHSMTGAEETAPAAGQTDMMSENVAPAAAEAGMAEAGMVQLAAEEAGKAEAGAAQAVQGDEGQVDFVNRVMKEIDQHVVSNEAENSEPVMKTAEAAELMSEAELGAKEEGAQAQVHHIEQETKKPGVEQSVPTQDSGAANAAQMQPAGATAVQPDAVVTVPADVQQARQVVYTSLLEQVESAVTAEKSELNIKFKPDVLGGLQIQLAMGEEGLRATIRTSDAAMRAVISAELTQLAEALRAKGIEVVEMNVYQEQSMANNAYLDQRSGAWQSQQQQQQGSAARSYFDASGADEGAYETAAYERMILSGEEGGEGGVIYSA